MAANAPSGERTATDTGRVLYWLLLGLLASVPLAAKHILWVAPGGGNDPHRTVPLVPSDLVLFVLTVVCVADIAERRHEQRQELSLPALLLAATATWFTAAFLVHPSWRGVEWLLRLAGAWAIVHASRRLTPPRQVRLLAAIVVLSVGQACMGIAQSLTGSPLGLEAIEFGGNWRTLNGILLGRGSFDNSYQLAALSVLGIAAAAALLRRFPRGTGAWPLRASGFVMAIAIAFTFSRTVFLSLLPIIGILMWDRRERLLGSMLLAGLCIGILLGLDAHAAKAEQSADLQRFDTGRLTSIEDASKLIEKNPVFGVGPGRYSIALQEVDFEGAAFPPHNVVAHAAAEAGVVGGLLALATLASFGLWAVRRGGLALVAAITLVPFYALDVFPYFLPAGFVMSGLWIATVCVVASGPREGSGTEEPLRETAGGEMHALPT